MKTGPVSDAPAARYPRAVTRAVAFLFAGATGIVLLLGMPAVASILFDRLQSYAPIEQSHLSQLAAGEPTAIVILSAGRRSYAPEFAGETVDSLTLERIRYGAYIARQTRLPVLVTGGLDPIPLGQLMSEALAADYGIKARWTETASTNTAENAIYSSAILKRSGIRRVILVTHAWHMKRAVNAFRSNGMQVIAAPTAFYEPHPDTLWDAVAPNTGTLRMSTYAIHEVIGGVWYKLKYGY